MILFVVWEIHLNIQKIRYNIKNALPPNVSQHNETASTAIFMIVRDG